jgi:hypothetical protein
MLTGTWFMSTVTYSHPKELECGNLGWRKWVLDASNGSLEGQPYTSFVIGSAMRIAEERWNLNILFE